MDFTFDERLGIYFSLQSSCLSAAAVTILLAYVLYRWLKRMRLTWGKDHVYKSDASDSGLFLNLMLADLIQAIGNIPSAKWMKDAHITEGQLCTAQAAIKQVGINGVALTSFAIALHTFSVLVFRWRAPRHFSKFVILGIWVFTGLVVGIPNAVHRKEIYYGDTGYWCWIVTKYKTEQIMSEYLWVWMAGILMAILYGVMFFVMRGYIILEDGIHWHKRKQRVKLDITATENEEDKESRAIANLLLFYPAVYIFCVFPNSLSRWMYFSGRTVPGQFTLFASALFAFSGMFNVILFFSTRPELVVGQSPSPPLPPTSATSPASPSHTHQKTDLYSHVHTTKYGHLPHRPVENLSDNAEKGNLLLDHEIHQSPVPSGLILSPSTGTARLSPQDGSRGRPSSFSHHRGDDDDDDDDYGRLPG